MTTTTRTKFIKSTKVLITEGSRKGREGIVIGPGPFPGYRSISLSWDEPVFAAPDAHLALLIGA